MKWENGEKEREGEERRKAGRSSLAGKTLESLLRETKGGGSCKLRCKLRELLVPYRGIATINNGRGR